MNSTERPWSDLPQELLSAIADSLTSTPNLLNTLSFRSVCNSWRNSCPPYSHPSILSPILPFSTNHFLLPYHTPHSSLQSIITVTVIYTLRRPILSPSIPYIWVVFVDEFEPGKVKIRLPFSKGSYNMHMFFPDCVNLFDFDVREIGRFYNLCYSSNYDDRFRVKLAKPRFYSEDVIKVVWFDNGEISIAIALFQKGKLGLCSLKCGGFMEGEWEVLHCGKGFRFDDIIDFNGRVLGVDRRGRVYEISPLSFEVKPVAQSIFYADGKRNRLVESLGLLYLVVRCDVGSETDVGSEEDEDSFEVYKLNEKKRKWVEVGGIGDRVFFFGIEFSFSVSARELWFRKNCIVFKEHSFQSYNGEVVVDDDDDDDMFSKQGKYDLHVGVCHLDDGDVDVIESFPGYADTLWPPPAWIWPTTRVERLKIVDAAVDDLISKIPENIETMFQDMLIKVKAFQGPCDDLKTDYCDIREHAHFFKEVLNKVMEDQEKLMGWEKELQVSMYNLNKMRKSLVQSQTESCIDEEWEECRRLKKILNQGTENELKHVDWEKQLRVFLKTLDNVITGKEIWNLETVNEAEEHMNWENELKVFQKNLDHIRSSESLSSEEREDYHRELHGAIQKAYFRGVCISWDICYMAAKHNANTFRSEDVFCDFSELVRRWYSLLNC